MRIKTQMLWLMLWLGLSIAQAGRRDFPAKPGITCGFATQPHPLFNITVSDDTLEKKHAIASMAVIEVASDGKKPHRCTGSIISKHLVLTTSSCIPRSTKPSNVTVNTDAACHIGCTSRKSPHPMKHIYRHERLVLLGSSSKFKVHSRGADRRKTLTRNKSGKRLVVPVCLPHDEEGICDDTKTAECQNQPITVEVPLEGNGMDGIIIILRKWSSDSAMFICGFSESGRQAQQMGHFTKSERDWISKTVGSSEENRYGISRKVERTADGNRMCKKASKPRPSAEPRTMVIAMTTPSTTTKPSTGNYWIWLGPSLVIGIPVILLVSVVVIFFKLHFSGTTNHLRSLTSHATGAYKDGSQEIMIPRADRRNDA